MKVFIERIKTFLINFSKADKDVQIRTIALVISIINLILYLLGKNQISVDAEIVWRYVTIILTTCVSTRVYWKNNDITPIARQYTHDMRAAKQTIFEEVDDEFITEDENEGEEE